MTSSENERSDSGGSNSGCQGVSSLLEVDLSVPSSPDSERMSHSASTAHVTVGTLARSVSTRASHSWNSGNGSTGTPREGSGVHTREVGDSMSLSGVSRQVVVNEGHDIMSERSAEDLRKLDFAGDFLLVTMGKDTDGRSG